MRDRVRLIPLLPALVFFLAAGLLLRPALDRYGVSVTDVALPNGAAARLYRSGDDRQAGPAAFTDDDGHTHTLAPAGGSAAALLLRERGDGADALAAELARRGVAVLAAAPGADPDRAWEALTESGFARLSSLALLGGESALALADRLAGSGKEPAAVVLRGDGALLERAAASRARNILFLTGAEPDPGTLAAFLGEEERKPMAIGGYFAEGTARRAVRPAPGRWDERENLLPVIDWLGSSLGHAVELPDEDLPTLTRKTARTAAATCAALGAACAGGALLRRRKRSEET